ncbi:cytochrome bd-I oxidase subunit CydX [Orbus wheelerorum]
MYYVLWATVLAIACLLAVVTGVWIDRKIDEKNQD